MKVKREEQEQVGLGLGLVDRGKERNERATRRATKHVPAGAVGARVQGIRRGH